MAASTAPTTTNANNAAAAASPAAAAAAEAASSPAKTGTLAIAANRTETPPVKSSRGQNKPKCRQCGNVARSRCPYESCKSCCSRNQNPCHIHVLKASSTSEKTPSSAAAPLDQQTSETPQSTAGRVASLRQLSNSFAQFNNLHISLRSRKPLTIKDAAAINEWRYSKLKEDKERGIDLENEAFDRYMENAGLLEEVLSVKSLVDNSPTSESNPAPTENNEVMIPGMKLQLRSNSTRSDRLRKRIQQTVDEGLKKLQNSSVVSEINEPVDGEAEKASKRVKMTERLSAISDLVEKVNKARTEEDLKACMEMKLQLFNSDEGSDMVQLQEDNETNKNQTSESDALQAKELDYSLPKLVKTTEIDQETLNTIDKHFSSSEHIEEL